jgi:TRAP-type uncharacterized transport system substrate-binding protein
MELKLAILGRIGIIAMVLAVLGGCDELDSEMRFMPPAYQNVDLDALEEIFAERSGIDLTAALPGTRMSALEALTSDVADLALVDNSAPFTPGVRAVLPVYQSVLHVIARKNFKPHDAGQPLKGATIYIADNSGAGHKIIEVVAKRQGVTLDQLRFVDSPEADSVDLILYFGPINPDNPTWYRPGYELVSLAKRLNPENEELDRDGVGYIIPKMHAAVIPALTYDIPGNEEPIVTIGADTLLVARSSVPVRLIYELTKTLIEQKPRFTAIAPHLFGGINESFDPLELSFPLHAGARFYLHRDEPGLLERYAETINLLVYMVFLLLSAGVAFARWRLHRKKDRIDTFYVAALGIQEQANAQNTEELLVQLAALEQEAFKSLIDEKLSANESFRIFTDLLLRVRTDLLAKKEN